MKIKLLLISLLVAVAACNPQADFESIFNGEDLDGWVVKCVDADKATDYWFVDDGCILANSMGDSLHDYIWLQYDKELTDFHMKFKFQPILGNMGNSGVQIRSRYDESEQWLNGPQLDIHPRGAWRSGMIYDETRGYQRWIFPNLPKGKWVNPNMAFGMPMFYYKDELKEWNEMEIIAEGTKVQAWINGIRVADFNGDGILDDDIHANLGVGMKGYICFQIHAKDQLEIRFKEIELKELD